MGHQRAEGKEKLGTLLSLTRLFMEFGDDNRAPFATFLEGKYAIQIDCKGFKINIHRISD
jgi:hypothetical protein